MKPLDEIFNEEDCLQIVEWAHGRKPGKVFHVNIVNLDPKGFDDWPDHKKFTYLERYGNRSQELEISFTHEGDKDATCGSYRVTISDNGGVEYNTWADCGCRLENPLHIYQLVMKRFEEAGVLEETMKENLCKVEVAS